MKTLIILALTFTSLAYGGTTLTLNDFAAMNVAQKTKVIEAYKDFLREYSKKSSLGEFTSTRFSFFAEAIAAGNFDCFYAGWPSQTVRSGSKRLCTTPVRGNPDYPSQAANCGENSLLCQPALFGPGLCVSTATKRLRNSAFSQCETKFREAGRTTASIISALTSPEQRANLDELIITGQSICATGLQKGTGMCSRLVSKLIAIKNELPPRVETQTQPGPQPDGEPQTDAEEQPDGEAQSDEDPQTEAGPQTEARPPTETTPVPGTTTLETAAHTAVQVTSTTVEPTPIDCDPNEPGIQTEPPREAQVDARRTEARIEPSAGPFRPRTCPRPEITATRPRAEMDAFLAANNIHIVAGTVTDDRHLHRFIDDFHRFPQSLREEMKTKGSRINLIIGNGVTEDPSWQREAARSNRPQDFVRTHDDRDWSQIPGSGGSLGQAPTPTRLVINRSYSNEGLPSIFLHEYAHTLDSMYGRHAITRSRIWQEALNRETNRSAFLQNLCANGYCNNSEHPEEAFAELFAYYHACAETKAHMREHMPNVSRLFDRLTSVKALLEGQIRLEPNPQAASR